MKKILKKYHIAWLLRKKGLTLKEVSLEMKISSEWVRTMIKFIEFKISNKNKRKISNELKELIKKVN